MAFALLLGLLAVASAKDLSGKDGSKAFFRTEPGYRPTYFTVHNTSEDSRLFPGYIFFDPVHGAPDLGIGGEQAAPQIREPDGTLVWYGGQADDYEEIDMPRDWVRVQDFHACSYFEDEPTHLCWSENVPPMGKRKVVLDNTYQRVDKFKKAFPSDTGKSTKPNLHEFNTVNRGRHYLQVAWPIRITDLRSIGGPEVGYIFDGCFQDIDIETRQTVFDWCWMDHFPIWVRCCSTNNQETNLFPSGGPNTTNITSPKVGSGEKGDAFDAWHVNAVDKNEEGDYLLSTRHDDQILKIAGNNNVHGVSPGKTLWRLGGRGSTIKMNFTFAKQHDVRFFQTTESESIITFHDNSWEGVLEPTAQSSSGVIVSVNNITNTATLLHRYPNPQGELAPNLGSLQMLPNDNVLVSWGSRGSFSEFTREGELLQHATYTNETQRPSGRPYTFSYRLTKSPWVGLPASPPKLLAYSLNCHLNTSFMAYVSWNGATKVRYWEFHVADMASGPWIPVGTRPKTGFETEINLSQDNMMSSALVHLAFPRYISVTALDEDHKALDNGIAITNTFIPVQNVRHLCDEHGCQGKDGNVFRYAERFNCSDLCAQSVVPRLFILAVLVVALELAMRWYMRVVLDFSDRSAYIRLSNTSVETLMIKAPRQSTDLPKRTTFHRMTS